MAKAANGNDPRRRMMEGCQVSTGLRRIQVAY
jgi:hypothetical protein